MSSINKINFINANYSFTPTNNNLSDALDLTYRNTSTSTSAIDRKRKIQFIASSVIRNNQNESRPFKRAKISNAEIVSSSRNNSDPAAGMRFIPASSFRRSLFDSNYAIVNNRWCNFNAARESAKILAQIEAKTLNIDDYCSPNVKQRQVSEPSSSSSSVISNFPVENSDGWCSFNPNIGSTKTLSQIEAGTLDVNQCFPDGFEINDEEWEQLEPLLPGSIANINYPRGLINVFILYLLHESVSDTAFYVRNLICYKNSENEYTTLKLKNIKNDLYEVKCLISMHLVRFRGFFSTKYKTNDNKKRYNIKKSFTEDLDKLVKSYFISLNKKLTKAILPLNFNSKRKINIQDIRFLIYLGVGAGFTDGLIKTCDSNHDKAQPNRIELLHNMVLNTNIVSCLNDYIRENCPNLKKYWMPHLI